MIRTKTAAIPVPAFTLLGSLVVSLCVVATAAWAAAEPANEAPQGAGAAAPAASSPSAPAAAPSAPSAAGVVPSPPAGALAPDSSPDKIVTAYLEAMQGQRFAESYGYVSKTLKAGKSQEEWAKEQQYIVQMGEVKIFGFKVFPAAIQTDGTARVPNILKSQDKYLNQLGLDEYELYELVKEDGQWKIDQQTLVEGADRGEYFPEDAVQP
ncbi:MAG: hypothetical protein HY899_19215 [Deltaproteobacteria bacterium]|nr:hypothetical protein [Deltaproteobacteria bacterium]